MCRTIQQAIDSGLILLIEKEENDRKKNCYEVHEIDDHDFLSILRSHFVKNRGSNQGVFLAIFLRITETAHEVSNQVVSICDDES